MRRYYPITIFLLLTIFLLAACDTETVATPASTQVAVPTAEEIVEPTEEPVAEPTEEVMEPTEELMEEPTLEPTEEPTVEPTEAPTEEPTVEPTEEAMTEMGEASIGLQLIAEGLTSPIALVAAPDDSGRLFVADQIGQIRILTAEGQMADEPFLDIGERMVALNEGYDERGLLGLAFHPEFSENGRFFVYYSAPLRAEAPADWNHTSHVSEFTAMGDNPNTTDPDSEQILLQIDQPQGNHNAGSLAFGADGYLYIPLGDGGAADDVALGHVEDWYETNAGGNGQDLAQNLLGSILRIDVDNEGANGEGYAIPADNPFADQEGAEAIWAIGFRNPYRMSFDTAGDRALFVGDAGQNLWEEVSIVEAGGNYGWNVKEGTHCFSTDTPNQSLDDCPDMDADGRSLIDPIIEYQNANAEGGLGLVVIGGNVYRGSALPDWDGYYIFGDWSTGFEQPNGTLLMAMPPEAGGEMWTMQELIVEGSENGRLNEYLLSFGQDNDGEIYILTTETPGPSGNTGKVYKLVPSGM
jgi:glucose/arabinose dehydrogenase